MEAASIRRNNMMRALIVLAGIALLSACGEAEEDVACCAIVPKAKCNDALLAAGASRAETALLTGPGPVCPSDAMSAQRISELDAAWPAACRAAGVMSPEAAVAAGMCAVRAPVGTGTDS